MKNNIDKFDILVGRILGSLYSEFPIKTTLMPEKFGIKDSAADMLGEMDIKSSETDELIFFEASVGWLIENELIIAKSAGYGSYYDVRLTLKGLKLLKVVPESMRDDKKTLGDKLKELSKTGREELLKESVKTVFNLGMKYLGLV